MKYIYIFICLFLHSVSFGQSYKTIYVYDSISHKPVPFSNITIYERETIKNGFYTDKNGFAKIIYDKNSTLVISCIGFETKNNISSNDLKDTIFLKQNSINLNEIIVTNNFKTKSLGFANLKKN